MGKYTKEDIVSSPQTLVKFFLEKEKANDDMFDEAYEYYIKKSRHKGRKKHSKTFKRNFNYAKEFYLSAFE